MYKLYTTKLCGFLLPVNWQGALEPNQLSLPVLTKGGQGAPQGKYQCKHQWPGVTVALWNCPAFLQNFSLVLSLPGTRGRLAPSHWKQRANNFYYLYLSKLKVPATPAVPSHLPSQAGAVEGKAAGVITTDCSSSRFQALSVLGALLHQPWSIIICIYKWANLFDKP